MTDAPATRSLPFNLNAGHLISGGGAAGLALVGSLYVSKHQIEENTARLDKLEASQVEVIRTSDQARNNAQRIASLERQLQWLLSRMPPVPTDPHWDTPSEGK